MPTILLHSADSRISPLSNHSVASSTAHRYGRYYNGVSTVNVVGYDVESHTAPTQVAYVCSHSYLDGLFV